jgi:acyl-CoA thioester hydrolase
MSEPFSCQIRVRFGECDMQGVVFNAHYLAYVDDTMDQWFAAVLPKGDPAIAEIMVKKATVEWTSAARYADVLDLAPRVVRWGNSSFDVEVRGSIDGRGIFVATLVYVSVDGEQYRPTPVPDHVRAALSERTPA